MKIFLALLIGLGATINSVTPTYNLSLRQGVGGANYIYDKAFMLFPLPSLSGGTFVSALLYCKVAGSDTNALTVYANTSADVSWTEATAVATMDAITLSATLDSKSITTAENWYSWNVTGDAAKGLQKAYADAATSYTLALTQTAHDATPIAAPAEIESGSAPDEDQWGFYTRGSADHPYLVITYTPAAGSAALRKQSVVHGISF